MAASGADYTGISHVYPSPERDEDESQPSEQQKPAAKRKRENRYKNAPPSVLSVCHNPSKAAAGGGRPTSRAPRCRTHGGLIGCDLHSDVGHKTAHLSEHTANARTRG